MPEAPAAPTSRAILRALGIAGWSALEPAILAALATESPILLIGPHGTAKTLLLARLAEALGPEVTRGSIRRTDGCSMVAGEMAP